MHHPGPERAIFANRTLNLRSIRAIGYDMDYTLVDYDAAEWERIAFEHTRQRLADRGWPVADVAFDAAGVIRGLAIDLELGNLVKATRFGYVIRATHGTRVLEFDELRSAYSGQFVDLAEDRYEFVNTLFGLSEASLYAQLVDRLDSGEFSEPLSYEELYRSVRRAIDEAHRDGALKAEILADPGRFVLKDPDIVRALEDQRRAGKRLVLITDSEWEYTQQVMSYAFDDFIEGDGTWRDLFAAIVVSARKPGFFTERNPLYKVVDEERALLRPHHGSIEPGSVFFGGNAAVLEESLGISGAEMLHVGDHLLADVRATKAMLRWRTAIILRELEQEVLAQHEFAEAERELHAKMYQKVSMERRVSELRLDRQRRDQGYAPAVTDVADPTVEMESVLADLAALDLEIAPLAKAAATLGGEWGPLMRAGNDKSLFARQMERYADIYTSRVANFLYVTPFAYLRAARSSLPHDLVEWIATD